MTRLEPQLTLYRVPQGFIEAFWDFHSGGWRRRRHEQLLPSAIIHRTIYTSPEGVFGLLVTCS
jgi:hypothetical protein